MSKKRNLMNICYIADESGVCHHALRRCINGHANPLTDEEKQSVEQVASALFKEWRERLWGTYIENECEKLNF